MVTNSPFQKSLFHQILNFLPNLINTSILSNKYFVLSFLLSCIQCARFKFFIIKKSLLKKNWNPRNMSTKTKLNNTKLFPEHKSEKLKTHQTPHFNSTPALTKLIKLHLSPNLNNSSNIFHPIQIHWESAIPKLTTICRRHKAIEQPDNASGVKCRNLGVCREESSERTFH